MSQVIDLIRAKYPQYANVDNDTLVSAIGSKYPQYLQSDQNFAEEYRVQQSKARNVGFTFDGQPSVPRDQQAFNASLPAPTTSGRGNPFLAAMGLAQAGPVVASQMQPGVGKALVEQVNAQNLGLSAMAPALLAGPKALSYPLRALFAAQGAKMAGQALGERSATEDPGQRAYLATQALLGGAQTLAAPGLEKPVAGAAGFLGDLAHVLRTGQEPDLYTGKPILGGPTPQLPSSSPTTPLPVVRPTPDLAGAASPVTSQTRATALPFDAPAFKQALKQVPTEQLGPQYEAIQQQSRQLLAAGRLQDASLNITKGQFVREELQSRHENQSAVPQVQQTPSQPKVAEASGLSPEEQNARLHDFARDLSRVQAQAALRGQLPQFGVDVRPALQTQLSMRSRLGQLTESDFQQAQEHVQQLQQKYASSKPSTARIPRGQQGAGVDEGTSLRQQGQVAPARQGQEASQGGQVGQPEKGQVQTEQKGTGQGEVQTAPSSQVSRGQPANARPNGGRDVAGGVLGQEGRNKELADLLVKRKGEAGSIFPKFGGTKDEATSGLMNQRGETLWHSEDDVSTSDVLKRQGETEDSFLAKGNLRLSVYGDDLMVSGKPNPQQLKVLQQLNEETGKRVVTTGNKTLFEPFKSPVQLVDKTRASEAGSLFPRFGVSRRATAERAASGALPQEPEPGDVMEPEEIVERGRQLLAEGVDPEKALGEALKGGYTSRDVIAVTRAKGEELARAASATGLRYGYDSPEYKAAQKADYDWIERTKPLGTAAGESMRALQGTTSLDTGDFHSMARAYKADTGLDFTPEQSKQAQEHVKANVEATAEVMKAKTALEGILNKLLQQFHGGEAPKPESRTGETGSIFPGKNGPLDEARAAGAKRTANEAAAIWEYAKQAYLNDPKFKGTFDEMANKVAIDLGTSKKQVVEALFRPKGVKEVSDAMYRAMDKQRRVKQAAEAWLQSQKIPGWARAARMIPNLFFMDKIFLHGTVLPTTHAAVNLFHPGRVANWVRAYTQGWKMAYSSVKHEQWVQDMVNRDNFTMWKRAGLAVDPERYYEDYQNAMMKSWWSKMNVLTGKYGADSLKEMRFLFAEHIWDQAPAELKMKDGKVNREFTKQIATLVNHATGVVQGKMPEALNWTFFAPRLEASRWSWLLGDVAKAGTILAKGAKATPEERWFAMSKAKEMAWIVGTYYGLLALNQGILSASGSPQQINFTNPHRSDFMSFKAAGHNVGIIGPMLGVVRLLANLISDSVKPQTKLQASGLESRRDAIITDVGHYVTTKLSPFAGFGLDLASQSDYRGRPLPWSQDQPPTQLRRAGVGKYGYGEYAAQQFLPIPFEEGIKEVWMSQGMDKTLADRLWLGLLSGAATATTGTRVEPDLSTEPKPAPHKEPFQIKPPSFKGKKFSMGDILKRGGKQYMVTGFDTDGHPLVDEVGQEAQAA